MPEPAPSPSLRPEDNTTAFNSILRTSILATSENLTDAEARAMMDRRHAEHAPALTDAELITLLGVTLRKTAQYQDRPASGRGAAAADNRRQLRGWRDGHTALLREARRRNMPVPAHLVARPAPAPGHRPGAAATEPGR